jgi:RNA polymerase sigma-70 factor (ECF subfamily)
LREIPKVGLINKMGRREAHRVVWHKGASIVELETLYRERGDHFVRVAAAVTGNGEIGRDVVQDAFAIAIRQRVTFRGGGPLEAWVWTIVVNTARRYARKRGTQPLAETHETSSNGRPVDELGVRGWIAVLPERQREMLFLRYYADLDYRQIARILEVEVGTVSATLSAAHTKLRVALREVHR